MREGSHIPSQPWGEFDRSEVQVLTGLGGER